MIPPRTSEDDMLDPDASERSGGKPWYRRRWVWLLLILVVLESEGLPFSLFITRSQCSMHGFDDRMDPEPPYAEIPLQKQTDVILTTRSGDAMTEGFVSSVSGVLSPRGDVRGTVELEAEPPLWVLPLIRVATIPYTATADLDWRRGDTPVHVRARVTGEISMRGYGLIGLRKFRVETGRQIGEFVKMHLSELLSR
jgi:hypothetical protein